MRLIPLLLVTAMALLVTPPANAQTPADGCGGEPGLVIPAVTIPAVVSPPVIVPDQYLAGHLVPGFTIGGVDVPEQTMPAQCIEIGDAPPGCLGEITVPGRTLPGIDVPSVTIPAISIPGFSYRAITIAGSVSGPQTRPAEVTPGLCAPSRGQRIVLNQSSPQPGLHRWGAWRSWITRSPVCHQGSCLPAIDGPSLTVASVLVPGLPTLIRKLDLSVPTAFETRCTRVYSGDRREAHVLCPRELFRPGTAALRPSAARILRVVAKGLQRHRPRRTIHVDAHVHDAGTTQQNRRASVRQAAAVKRWLVRRAGVPATRLRARGYGDAWPAERRSGEGGASRVVLSVELE